MLVGKTRRQKACQFYGQEHPCVRGENWVARSTPWRQNGTSPRTRGKLDGIALVPDLLRNIPAYAGKRCGLHSRGPGVGNIPAHAGKTQSPWPYRHPSKEHPRARGENRGNLGGDPELRGTSPRARGKQPEGVIEAYASRNIPACAGKTMWLYTTIMRHREHPRVRGENACDVLLGGCDPGTSPRARGKLALVCPHSCHRRNIPACAGKTTGPLPS